MNYHNKIEIKNRYLITSKVDDGNITKSRS